MRRKIKKQKAKKETRDYGFNNQCIHDRMQNNRANRKKGLKSVIGIPVGGRILESISIEYAVVCNRGLLRDINQDNFWCANTFLDQENEGLEDAISGRTAISTHPVFLVFDGLGGEVSGELAAWVSASTFNSIEAERFDKDSQKFLIEAFDIMNEKVNDYAISNRINHMGSTAAALLFEENTISVCNIGDSKVFQYCNGVLSQLSEDHVSSFITGEKSYLLQYLGISRDEFHIEPYCNAYEYSKGDRFLLCTDGLSDMISDSIISSALAEAETPVGAVHSLQEEVIKAGGKDNFTILVCDVIGV